MAVPHAEKLIERARGGETLPAPERRHCVAYFMAMHPETTNHDMAEVFGVSARQIRKDKEHIRCEKADVIKKDDIGLVIADIIMTLENEVRDIQRSKNKCALGSRQFLEHCKTVFNMKLKSVTALQELGYYPKNLGTLTEVKYDFQAKVGSDGSVVHTQIHDPDYLSDSNEEDVLDGEFEEQRLIAPPEPEE